MKESNVLTDQECAEIRTDFDQSVNMSAGQLEKWLGSAESQSVGQRQNQDDHESIGHKSGEEIVKILGKKVNALSDTDYDQMRRVNNYVKRHLAQKPADVSGSNWLYSLKNWGHDAEKD